MALQPDGRASVGSHGTFSIAFPPAVAVLLIAVEDIGAFAAIAFGQPDIYIGKTLEIGGDALTPPQIAAPLSRATGRTIPYVQIPIETLRQQNEEAARAFTVSGETSLAADIPALRTVHPGLMDFDTWLKKEGAAQFALIA